MLVGGLTDSKLWEAHVSIASFPYHEAEVVIGLLLSVNTHFSGDSLLPGSMVCVVAHFYLEWE
jgi:hypothetical protein